MTDPKVTHQEAQRKRAPDSPSPFYRPDIDGLRGLSILLVIGFHAFPQWVPGGFIGVDVFFVISGFLISSIIDTELNAGHFSFRQFYGRRIKRLVPTLLLVLLFCAVLGWFALFPSEYMRLGQYIFSGAGFFSNLSAFGEAGYFDDASYHKPLIHLWSLGVEEQFYLFWPPVLWAIWRWRKRAEWWKTTLGIALLSFAVNSILSQISPNTAFYSPIGRMWEMLLGALLAFRLAPGERDTSSAKSPSRWVRLVSALLDPTLSPGKLADIKATIGLVMIFGSAMVLNEEMIFPGFWVLLPVVGAYLVLSAGPETLPSKIFLSRRGLVGLGLISYSLYLWHWPLLIFSRIIHGGSAPVVNQFIMIGVSVVFAVLNYFLWEKPLRFAPSRKLATLGLCAGLVIVGAFGYLIVQERGFPNRAANALIKKNIGELSWFGPDEDCTKQFGPETVFCKLPEKGLRAEVAVIGDSAANSLYPGIAHELKAYGKGVINLGMGTCAPFRGIDGTFAWNQLCPEVNEKIYRYLLSNPEIKVVVMGFTSWDFRSMTMPGSVPGASLEARFAALTTAVDRDIADLIQAGKKVIVSFDSINFAHDPRECLPRPIQIFSTSCRASESELLFRKPYLSFWEAYIPTKENICVFAQSPPLLRDGAYDMLAQDGHLLFRDDHHLSHFGSKFIASHFMQTECVLKSLGIKI